jgi:hypothetical protein
MEEQIFKIQLSQFSSDGMRRVLIYNEDRSIYHEQQATDEIVVTVDGRAKSFMWGYINHARKLILSKPAPWQKW